MVRLAEAAVDDDGLAVRLDGRLALLDLDGHMTVDDVPALGQTEFCENGAAEILVVQQAVVGIGRLLPCALVF